MVHLLEDSWLLRERIGLPVELSEIRTTSLPMDGRLKNVLTMERYTAITAIILAESWDSGREPAEP